MGGPGVCRPHPQVTRDRARRGPFSSCRRDRLATRSSPVAGTRRERDGGTRAACLAKQQLESPAVMAAAVPGLEAATAAQAAFCSILDTSFSWTTPQELCVAAVEVRLRGTRAAMLDSALSLVRLLAGVWRLRGRRRRLPACCRRRPPGGTLRCGGGRRGGGTLPSQGSRLSRRGGAERFPHRCGHLLCSAVLCTGEESPRVCASRCGKADGFWALLCGSTATPGRLGPLRCRAVQRVATQQPGAVCRLR